MKREVVECCPHCDKENVFEWDVDEFGYKAFCPHCGQKLMLCDECQHRRDGCDYCDDCDWNESTETCHRENRKKRYKVTYQEKLSGSYYINANSRDEALHIYDEMNNNGEIDFSGLELVDSDLFVDEVSLEEKIIADWIVNEAVVKAENLGDGKYLVSYSDIMKQFGYDLKENYVMLNDVCHEFSDGLTVKGFSIENEGISLQIETVCVM